jgi:hypothetical protein
MVSAYNTHQTNDKSKLKITLSSPYSRAMYQHFRFNMTISLTRLWAQCPVRSSSQAPFLAYFLYFKKIKVGSCGLHVLCVSVDPPLWTNWTPWPAQRIPMAVNLGFSRPEPLLFHSSSFSVVLTRLSGPRSRPPTYQKIWYGRESNPGPLDL